MRGAEDLDEMQGKEMPMHEDKETPMTEQGQPEGNGQTMSIPVEFVQGVKFKAGDEMILKVVSVDDGKIEVEYATAPESENESGGPSEPPSADAELEAMDSRGGY